MSIRVMFIYAPPSFYRVVSPQKLLRISMAGQMCSYYPSSPAQQPVHFALAPFSFSFSFPSSSNVVIFNHLISWHNEQIAMSCKLRPLETKQRECEGVGEGQLYL